MGGAGGGVRTGARWMKVLKMIGKDEGREGEGGREDKRKG